MPWTNMLTYYISVDTCTDLLPENKPRYVMGIVRFWESITSTREQSS